MATNTYACKRCAESMEIDVEGMVDHCQTFELTCGPCIKATMPQETQPQPA